MSQMSIPKATLGRIPRYLSFLKELSLESVPYISATTIAKELHLGEVQVRKDLSMVSGAGRPKIGYDTEMLIGQLEDCLGYNQLTPAVLVGAGRLGRALLQYDGFEHFGVKITAAFDCNEHRIGLGIITVGEGSAQEVCDQMVASGITAIWNFAPCKLQIPDGIILQNENLALSLAHLRNRLSRS